MKHESQPLRAATSKSGRRLFVRSGLPLTLGLVLGAAGLCSTGCVQHVALRHGMRSNYPYAAEGQEPLTAEGKPRKGIDDLQLFTSDRIMLRRRHRHGDKRVKGGKIVSRKGKLVEEVVVWAKTPGVVVDAGDDWLDVSFAEGTQMRFAVVERQDPSTGDAERTVYQLEHEIDGKGRPVVEFEGHRWRPADRSTAATLMVRRKAHGSFKWRRTRLRGMRVGEA